MTNELTLAIDKQVLKHGSLRAAGAVLGFDHGYLWRLQKRKKNNPSDKLLRKLKLRRIVTIEYQRTDKP